MEGQEQKKKLEIQICPRCEGSGVVDGRTCERCDGAGVTAVFGRQYFFWTSRFEMKKIWMERVAKIWGGLVNIVLWIVGLIGVLAVAREVLGLYELDVALKWVVAQEHYWAWLWWSILVDAFLIYRLLSLAREKAGRDWRNLEKLEARERKAERRHKLEDWSTGEARKVVYQAWGWANKLGQRQLLNKHIFLALLSQPRIQEMMWRLGYEAKSLAGKTLIKNKEDAAKVPEKSEDNKERVGKGCELSRETEELLARAAAVARETGRARLDMYALLMALSAMEGWVKEFLYSLEIDTEALNNVWLWLDLQEALKQERRYFKKMSQARPGGVMNKAFTAVATPFLDRFSNDLTALARRGVLGPCVGRDAELGELIHNFEAGHNATIIIGHPEVGKSSLIDGLAQKMVLDEIPPRLQDKRLISLSLSQLAAGGVEQSGAVGERFKRILWEIKRAGNIVLMIDDIHNLVGMGTVGQSLDIAKFLSEALVDRDLTLIATSNPVDYRKYLEGQELGMKLQVINIGEPDKNATIQILEAKAPIIEYRQEVFLTYKALKNTYDLATRYIHEHFLPIKAISLLEEAAAYARRKRGKGALVTADDAAQVLSQKTGVPAAKITQKEADNLLNLEDKIHEYMIDQVEAVGAVADALRRSRVELRDTKKPVASFLFLGPTGVGKTELAKTVARLYFEAEENMIRLDMSEYQEKNSVERILGTPGSSGGGILTEAVRKKPFALVLLDELEKAHPDLLNLFLQVLDDGRMTDNEGRVIDFSSTIIIATSNAGTQFIQDEIQKGTPVAHIKDILVREQLKQYFRPEFLNRFDAVVVFKPLGMEEIRQIAGLQVKKLQKQLLEKGIDLEVTPEALVELAKAGFDPLFGARPLKRAIQERVSDVLAGYLLKGEITRRDKVCLRAGGKLEVKKAEAV